MREALRVRLQFAICIARAILPTIVDVDVDICNTANQRIVRNQSQTRRGSGRQDGSGVWPLVAPTHSQHPGSHLRPAHLPSPYRAVQKCMNLGCSCSRYCTCTAPRTASCSNTRPSGDNGCELCSCAAVHATSTKCSL